jgi:hypothetical protein
MENYNHSLRDWMAKDRDFWGLIMETSSKIRQSYYDDFIVDCAFLKHRNTIEPEDAWAFIQLHYGIMTGEILTARIKVGKKPLSDDDVEGNNAILSTLKASIYALFQPERGGSAWDDGCVVKSGRSRLLSVRTYSTGKVIEPPDTMRKC